MAGSGLQGPGRGTMWLRMTKVRCNGCGAEQAFHGPADAVVWARIHGARVHGRQWSLRHRLFPSWA